MELKHELAAGSLQTLCPQQLVRQLMDRTSLLSHHGDTVGTLQSQGGLQERCHGQVGLPRASDQH